MADRLYQNTPYAEPEGFWPRLWWWLRQDYHRAEKWQREQHIRADERLRVLREMREAPMASDPLREALEWIAMIAEGQVTQYARARAQVARIATEALAAASESTCPRCHGKAVLDTSYIEEHGWEAPDGK